MVKRFESSVWTTGYSIMSIIRKSAKNRHFVHRVFDDFRSSETTQACKQGRAATVRLRCNPTEAAKDLITLPR